MTDSKNILIKVKYTAPDAEAELQPKIITEWNVWRIVGASGAVILLLAGVFFLWGGKPDQPTVASPTMAPTNEVKPPAAPAAAASIPAVAGESIRPNQALPAPVKAPPTGRVRRATLAYRIVGMEPADLIGSTVRVRQRRPIPVYYFTEVRDKKDQKLFHEWRKNGRRVLRHPVTVSSERWRASSQRQLGLHDQGNWSVRTVDAQGVVMNEIQFAVVAK